MTDATTRVLDVIRARPGITLPDLARAAGVTDTSLYTTHLPALQRDNVVVKDYSSRRWFAWPLPGCACDPGYVRDALRGHPDEGCVFHGLFGRDLAYAYQTVMDRLAVFGSEAA